MKQGISISILLFVACYATFVSKRATITLIRSYRVSGRLVLQELITAESVVERIQQAPTAGYIEYQCESEQH